MSFSNNKDSQVALEGSLANAISLKKNKALFFRDISPVVIPRKDLEVAVGGYSEKTS